MSASRLNLNPATFCALPLVRRAYQALVVGVAVFLLTLVLLHERFRGYLSEVHLAGPPTQGLDLDEAATWLRRADSRVAAVGIPAGEISPKSEIRVTYVSLRPAAAIARLDDLAERWLYQYLPDRLQTYRRSALTDFRNAVTAARAREDAARDQLESLRQQQMAQALHAAGERIAASVANQNGGVVNLPPPTTDDQTKVREKLESLRLELSRLLAHSTPQHPQVIAIAAEISALEGQLGIKPRSDSATNSEGPQLIPTPAGDRAQATGNTARAVSHFVSMPLPAAATDNAAADFTVQINAAFDAVSGASRERQVAEHRLNDRMQELSAQATAAQWSAGHAAVVTRLGGTPRSSVLALGAMLATVATALAFRAAGCSANEAKIETTAQLASAMKLPLIGNVSMLRPGRRPSWRLFTPQRVQVVVWGCEALVAIAVLACLVSIAAEPALVHQVLADPFGTLSEVMGRFL